MSTNEFWGADGSLEMKLLRMPFDKMVEAIKAIDDLDELLLMKLEEERSEKFDEERRKINTRKEKRIEFLSFRVALQAGFPPELALAQGKLAGFDHSNGLSRIFPAKPKLNIGMELFAAAMADILLNSQTDRRRYSMRYLQEGRLRAIAGLYSKNLHGDFLIFYPDGKIWMRGFYRNGTLVSESVRFFLPDGSLVKGTPPPNNVIPFRPKPGSSLE